MSTRWRKKRMRNHIQSVRKRDGSLQPFDEKKIRRSIVSAGKDTQEYSEKEAKKIILKVQEKIRKLITKDSVIDVQQIRDIVEPTIAESGFFGTAKYYILFGAKKQGKGHTKQQIIEPKLSDTALEVAKKRYVKLNMSGEVEETVGEMFWRVARHMAKAEIQWGQNGIVDDTARQFYERMVNMKFVCAGKAMFEAGNVGGTGQLSSCFVLPITDSIQDIFKTLGEAAVVHKNNGGTGFNFSKIRPHGDKVRNVPKASSGPVDFIRAFSAALSQILQGAKRQGANIAILNADHPDIIEFITMKDEDGTIKNFNVSVGVTNAFMEAVQGNRDWNLINPRNGEVWKTMKARDLFHLIAEHAWSSGDPGLAFLDRMEQDNPTPSIGKLEATNPCGEIALLPYESCNLTSVVLNNHVKKNTKGAWEIDWDDLEKSVRLGIRFLDDMIEVNAYALDAIRQMVKEGNRRIGLGVMGFAHMLYMMGVPYDSEEAVRIAERVAKFMRKKAEEMSIELGKERGAFPNFDVSIYAGSAERYRNCALMMIAPTGTTSLLADTSSGIEPVFSLVQVRRSFNEDNRKNAPTKSFTIVDPVFSTFLQDTFDEKTQEKILNQILKDGDLEQVKELSKEQKRRFITTHQIKPEWHIKIQSAWQKWIDNSVSKTINFSHDATIEDVKKAYMMGWKMGLKGITIYRDGSKMDQVLNVAGKESKVSKDAQSEKQNESQHVAHAHKSRSNEKEICPECASASLKFESGCVSCPDCGWSRCTL
ncbi:MAG TPA: adenosylcobalamin-dependent ribonucleoside-diphosphate reductase [Candidatus Pacebacteria bacterium]|nr:adenosylcobalamin-dependent ribonucleoside-diphosphate reductase [Candidatus Paceibacterota bacterium]